MAIKEYINKGREFANDNIKKYGNKLVPYVFTGKILGNKYGLGDVATYRLGRRHAGAVIGALSPGIYFSSVTGFEPLQSLAIFLATSPVALMTGLTGYGAGFALDMLSVKENARKKQKSEDKFSGPKHIEMWKHDERKKEANWEIKQKPQDLENMATAQ